MTAPMDLHRDLAAVLADLELIEAFERTARYGSALRGWVSDADGTRDTATQEAEVERLVELVFERDAHGALRPREIPKEHPRHRAVADARARLVGALLGSSERSIERDEEDRDWTHAIALQRRLRALGSHASTAVPAAVLRFMAARCPRSMSLGEVCDAVAIAFASAVLRDAWERARVEEAAAKISRLRRDGARCGGRPRGTRQRPSPALARAAFGRELVAWAVDVWLARAHLMDGRRLPPTSSSPATPS
ncbi:MAG: hypothetical protein U0326_39345 [Polyangiales bacterium]